MRTVLATSRPCVPALRTALPVAPSTEASVVPVSSSVPEIEHQDDEDVSTHPLEQVVEVAQ